MIRIAFNTMTAFVCLWLVASNSLADSAHPFVAKPVSVFRHDVAPGMKMPTDVAVSPSGRVFVADGVQDRVLEFASDGSLIRAIASVGEHVLSRPIGIDVDGEGRLWIADTGHGRVVIMNPDGSQADVITPPVEANGRAADITDVAVAADGSIAWLVINDSHRLERYDVRSRQLTAVGRLGESLGQLNHPFLISVDRGGAAHVTDVVNGRVSVFSATGHPARSVGEYGVELGDLYRPKGTAVDRDGNDWVSDSVSNVIHIFDPLGAPVDVLRNEAGEPSRFAGPVGIAIHDDDLFVVELSANQVQRLGILRGPVDPRRTPTRTHAGVTGRQARACTVCHLEWMEPLASGKATAIMPVPVSTPERPHVSRSENCLSCHDGSIVDSRRRVWLEHGHRTDIAPPAGMHVPPQLPLADGKIMCRTCHSAHAGGNFTGDMRSSVFLRVDNSTSQLCMGCHEDHTRGPRLGTHPTGGMPWPVPKELIAAGAKVGPNPREISCEVCHTPHGSSEDHLLVMGTSSNQLCLTCHGQMRPGMFREQGGAEHPISPVVNAEQKSAVEKLGTKLGPGERLICLSCHKLHHGKGQRFMLASELTGGEMCLSCHEDKRSLLGASHDLRRDHPDEHNRLGMTPESGGPCSSCHLFHRYARAPEPHPNDALGQCITCHQQGRCAENRPVAPSNHPGNRCTGCHNPHETRFGCYLKGPIAETCIECHSAQGGLLGGMHDLHAAGSNRWPAASLSNGDTCMACHTPHGATPADLFRIKPVEGQAAADAACSACHSQSMWGQTDALAMVHPRDIPSHHQNGTLPLVTDAAGRDVIGCITCHDPHESSVRLVRSRPSEAGASLCLQCHSDLEQIALTAHGHGMPPFDNSEQTPVADSCRACHSVHADPRAVAAHLLRPPRGGAESSETIVANWMKGEDRGCTACHASGGNAPAPRIASHPEIPMLMITTGGQRGALRLFDSQGREDAQGRITCRTCHTPHGNDLAGDQWAALVRLPWEIRRPMRLLVRPFDAPNLCTTCHGADGLWRFLYYHDPERRQGPQGADHAAVPDLVDAP